MVLIIVLMQMVLEIAINILDNGSSNIIKAPEMKKTCNLLDETGIYKVTIDADSEVKSLTAVTASPILGFDFRCSVFSW